MPILSNPGARAQWWFEHDQNIPLESRPVFLVRGMTCEQIDQHARIMDEQIEAAKDSNAQVALLDEALKIGIVGWENLTSSKGELVKFEADRLLELLLGTKEDPVLTDRELWTLAHNYPDAVSMGVRDFFHSRSAQPSDTGTPQKSA